MFGGYEIDAITNGVHAGEWTSPPFRRLFDRYLPGWEGQQQFALCASDSC
jgi:glycogen phosphorylase